MASVITFINEKGGTGKTSCCFNIGWLLSEKKKVLFVDMDGQKANLSFFAGVKKDDDMLTISDVLYRNKPLSDAIINIKKNLDIVPATNIVAGINQQAKISALKKALDSVRDKYDYILFDVNPSPQWAHFLSLSVSNYAIIPMLPDVTSLEGDTGVAETLMQIKESTNPDLKVLGILVNKNVNNTNLSKAVKDMAGNIAEQIGTSVFDTKIRMAVVLSENVSAHVGITDYDPRSDAANDVRAVVKEIERRIKNA